MSTKVTVIPPKPQFYSRVAVYCRVSSDTQEQLNSLKNQISYLTRFVSCHINWRLIDIYIDIQSGRNTSSRPEFQRMMDDCAGKKIDQIITKSVSRFGRNTVDTLAAINKLRELGVDVYFENEEMHSLDGNNVFMISILEGIAQEENAARSENIRWGIQRGMQSGKSKIFNRKCFGYVQDKNGNLIIQEDEAEIVVQIFELYLNGYSINAIRKELQRHEIKSPTGHDLWSKRSVDTLLQNEKYTGDVLVMKTFSEGYSKIKRRTNKGERDRFVSVGSHPAIISKDKFEKTRALRASRSNLVKGENGSARKSTRYSMKKAKVEFDNSSSL